MRQICCEVGPRYEKYSYSCRMITLGDVLKLGGWDLVVFVAVVYIIFVMFLKKSTKEVVQNERENSNDLPPMPKRDFTVEQLKHFDGVQNERILLAVCGKVRFIFIYQITRIYQYYVCITRFGIITCQHHLVRTLFFKPNGQIIFQTFFKDLFILNSKFALLRKEIQRNC